MLNIMICDDEKEWINSNLAYITKLSKRYKIQTKMQCFSRSMDISDEILANIDVAFLDIDLGEKDSNGLLLAQRIVKANKWAVIIFLTCHNQYTVQAFKMQAFGYLIKPINKTEFNSLFVKAILHANTVTRHKLDAILEFRFERNPVQLKQRDIYYIERKGRKVEIVTFRKRYLVNMSIKEIEKELESNFILINQSVIVNMDEIKDFQKDTVFLKTGEKFYISRNYLKNAREKYFVFVNNDDSYKGGMRDEGL